MRPRDNQRSRLYDAERDVFSWGQTIPTADLQARVDQIMAHRVIQARWGQRGITVSLTHSNGNAYMGGNEINLGVGARNPWVLCHEIAHCLTPHRGCAGHGPEFAGIYLLLVRTVIGAEDAERLRKAFREHRVRVSNKAIPSPDTTRVVTQAERRRQEREAAVLRRDRERRAAARQEREQEHASRRMADRREAAEVIRRAVKRGEYGSPGSKPRTYALATARRLEQQPA